MKDIAVVIKNSNRNVTPIDTMKTVKKAGFKNVFVEWYDEKWKLTQEEQAEICKQLGFNIIFAHLGYQNINDIWLKGEKGDALVERYQNDIKNCANHGINLVIMHLTSKTIAPIYNEVGLERIRKIVSFAKECGVRVAFENTKIKGYLEYVLDNIKDENVGICFDIGHCHCHFNDDFNFEKFNNRIFAVHLHDNDKSDDQHLLPFDGTIEWEKFIKNLNKANYKGPVTLEVIYRNDYVNKPIEDFYASAYQRAKKIAKMFEDYE